MVYGYIRVSAKEQNIDRQWDALLNFPVPKQNIFTDKESGKNFERPAYKHLIKALRSGDVLVILSIDRLGRNYDEILEQWRILTREQKADIVVLDFPLLDTRVKMESSNLTGRFLADLVLQILAYVAQTERENIRKRQAEGIASAKARGTHFGPAAKPLPADFDVLYQLWQDGKISKQELQLRCGMKRSTFYRRLGEYRALKGY